MRKSAWRGTWEPNKRPFITVAPDAYVSLQGETTVIGCGECRRKVNYNDYITGISTEASVDSPPGSATISMSIPDNDVNEFFVDGQFLIVPMMEVEIFAKGYYLIGGFPQYYRIFWGVVSNVSKSWSNGTSTISITCKDILRWWELTNATTNPAFLEAGGSSAGGYQLFQNQFAGQNPYATIVQLARDAMGDFFYTTGSFTSYTPEKGPQQPTIGNFMNDIMAYWQLKFANIQNSLVLFGMSGQAYSFSAVDGTVSPNQALEALVKEEVRTLKQNHSTTLFFSQPKEIATAKVEVARAGDVEFFQNETQSKLSLAMHARDQMGFEFYCDTTGDIIFKPPFYNLNVLPNKPVSWIQDFDIIDDQLNDSEAEVVTHVVSSGNAFGGVTDWGLNDEITTPRTGVYDFHLLRRYGWRHADLQLEWAGNPRKLFFHLLDWMDRLNAKRQNGTITIPMRPELRMGFPVWVPKYDSFFYVQGISHQYSVGGQATTTVTLTAKRSKFIAPKGIGEIEKVSGVKRDVTSDKKRDLKGADQVYKVTFPGKVGSTSGLSQEETGAGAPALVRDPKTGRLLGFPNAVMVYSATYSGKSLERIMETMGKKTVPNPGKAKGSGPDRNKDKTPLNYGMVPETLIQTQQKNKDGLISRLRAHRYEAGMTNAGAYDYAWDKGRNFRELALIPLNSYQIHPKETDDATTTIKSTETERPDKEAQKKLVDAQNAVIKAAKAKFDQADAKLKKKSKEVTDLKQKSGKSRPPDPAALSQFFQSIEPILAELKVLQDEQKQAGVELDAAQKKLAAVKTANPSISYIPQLNVLVRPVSDEFGFEVIGHYRYGRGAYIDRGKLQVQAGTGSNQGNISNQLSIQFAPTGGFLTDSPAGSNVDGQAVNFPSLFEQMRPEDYVTGASFSGTVKPDENVSNVQTTSASTYTNLINADKGTGLYIEADATRRARTLGEMVPTIEVAGLSSAFEPNKCGCGLNRTNWLSLLPTSLLADVLAPATSEGQDVRYTQGDADRPTNIIDNGSPGAKQVEVGSIKTLGISREGAVGGGKVLLSSPGSDGEAQSFLTSSGFFEALDKFLLEKFQKEYEGENVRRERAYTLGGIDNPANIDANPLGLGDDEQDNVLGDPSNPLFARAAQGDPAALAALQKQANFNFGSTSAAISNFDRTLDASRAKFNQIGPQFQQGVNNLGSPVAVTTGPGPQYQPPAPSVSDPINQRRFDNAGVPQNVGRDGRPLINPQG